MAVVSVPRTKISSATIDDSRSAAAAALAAEPLPLFVPPPLLLLLLLKAMTCRHRAEGSSRASRGGRTRTTTRKPGEGSPSSTALLAGNCSGIACASAPPRAGGAATCATNRATHAWSGVYIKASPPMSLLKPGTFTWSDRSTSMLLLPLLPLLPSPPAVRPLDAASNVDSTFSTSVKWQRDGWSLMSAVRCLKATAARKWSSSTSW